MADWQNHDDALHYFNVMIRLNPLPSTPCFVQLLGAAVRMKHFAAAIHMIKRMDSLGISRHVSVLNILINCLCHSKMSHLGFSVLTKMFKLGLEPGVVTLTTLLNGLCEEGKIARACAVVKALCRSGNTSKAVQLIRHLEERGCELNVDAYNTIINGYCKEGLVAEAFGVENIATGVVRKGREERKSTEPKEDNSQLQPPTRVNW